MGGAKQSKQGLVLKTGLQRENSTIYIKREAVSLRMVTMEKRKDGVTRIYQKHKQNKASAGSLTSFKYWALVS